MSAQAIPQAQPDAAPTSNRGRFQKGYDPRRHKFTRQECSIGFWNAVESIVTRYPDAIMRDGRHIVVNFMKSKARTKVIN